MSLSNNRSAMEEILNIAQNLPSAGGGGATFTPHVDEAGNLSWTNDKNLPNPESVNIKGPQGEDGKSAYEIALDNGFEGSEEEWLDSLKGEPGEDGTSADLTPYYINIVSTGSGTSDYKTTDAFNFDEMVSACADGRPVYIERTASSGNTKIYATLNILYEEYAIFLNWSGLIIETITVRKRFNSNGNNVTIKGQRVVGMVNNVQPEVSSFLGGITLTADDIPGVVQTVNGQLPDENGAVTVSNDPYVVNFTGEDGKLSDDFDFSKMLSAYKAGRPVCIVEDGSGMYGMLSHVSKTEDEAVFIGAVSDKSLNIAIVYEYSSYVYLNNFNKYTLPTMDKNTKGGAKVGKGLKMEGEALTINAGDGLEVVDGSMRVKPEGVYEEILEYIIDETFNGYLNVTNLNHKKINIDAYIPMKDDGSGTEFRAMSILVNNKYRFLIREASTQNTSGMYVNTTIWLDAGKILARSGYTTIGASSLVNYDNARPYMAAAETTDVDKIEKISISTTASTFYDKETRFVVKGVKAN